jgi:small subunit ribosomal protein S17
MATEQKKSVKKVMVVGHVLSDKMDKTIIVQSKNRIKHPRLGKYLVRKFKVHAHDENNDAQMGDKVEVQEVSRRLSKSKRWVLKKVVEKAQ